MSASTDFKLSPVKKTVIKSRTSLYGTTADAGCTETGGASSGSMATTVLIDLTNIIK